MTATGPTAGSDGPSQLTERILTASLNDWSVEPFAVEVGGDTDAAWALGYRWSCCGGSPRTGALVSALATRAPLAAAALCLSESWWFSNPDGDDDGALRNRAEFTGLIARIAASPAPALTALVLRGFLTEGGHAFGEERRMYDNSWIPDAVESALLAAA
jgi:hypothetical protein